MLSFLFRDRSTPPTPLPTDFHSHLLPAIDDGVKTREESWAVMEQLLELGYKKIITTPHIMSDFFGNTEESILENYQVHAATLSERGYALTFECAAEYYLDENLIAAVANKKKLLTFGERHLLFETNMISEPLQLKQFIFTLTTDGYRPVLAHPERYQYMTLEKAEDLHHRGVLLQLNMLSLIGYYGPDIQKLAIKMIDQKWVDALGSDCHHLEHALLLKKVQQSKPYRKAIDLPLLNHTL